jgi:ADP-ribosylglycohydrolase
MHADDRLLPKDGSHLPADHSARMSRARLCLTGLSVGDALGEQFFYFPELIGRRELPAPRWHYTDDTVMAKSIVAVLDFWGEIHQDMLAAEFGGEYLAEPHRGYGGTAHGILQRLGRGSDWRDVSPRVFNGEGSMGNGGAMRSGPIGAYFADDIAATVENARRSAEVTHAHPDGQAGAIAVAVAAAYAWRRAQGDAPSEPLLQFVARHTPAGPTLDGINHALTIPLDADVHAAVAALGNGSRIIASDTVPFCLWCAARHVDSYEDAFWTTVSGMGDRDTTCAIVGGIVGLSVGVDGMPEEWRLSREAL